MNETLQKRIEEAAKRYAWANDTIALPTDKKVRVHIGEEISKAVTYGAVFTLQNQWISVEEALPDDDENVLLILDDGHIIVAYHSGNHWWWCDGFVCGTKTNGQPMYSSSQRVDDKPTHWMYIPSLEGGEK